MLTPIRSKDLFASKLSVYEIFVGASPFLLVLHIFHTTWLMKSSFKSKQILPLFWMSIFSPLFFFCHFRHTTPAIRIKDTPAFCGQCVFAFQSIKASSHISYSVHRTCWVSKSPVSHDMTWQTTWIFRLLQWAERQNQNSLLTNLKQKQNYWLKNLQI